MMESMSVRIVAKCGLCGFGRAIHVFIPSMRRYVLVAQHACRHTAATVAATGAGATGYTATTVATTGTRHARWIATRLLLRWWKWCRKRPGLLLQRLLLRWLKWWSQAQARPTAPWTKGEGRERSSLWRATADNL